MRSNIPVDTILRARGLGDDPAAQRFLANEVARLSDPYVPMAPGSGAHMKNRYDIEPDGSAITYHGPYAHFQHEGMVMVGRESGSPWAKSGEEKVVTERALSHHGAPMRGPHWERRMLADRGGELTQAFARRVGGRNR